MRAIIFILFLLPNIVLAASDSCLEKVHILKENITPLPKNMYNITQELWSENNSPSLMVEVVGKIESAPLVAVWAVITSNNRKWALPVSLFKEDNLYLVGPIIVPSNKEQSLRLVVTYETSVACEGGQQKYELPFAINIT